MASFVVLSEKWTKYKTDLDKIEFGKMKECCFTLLFYKEFKK